MNAHEKINYVEFPAKDLARTQTFYSDVFGWSFIDYGSEYCAIQGAGLDGGFYQSELKSTTDTGGALIVIYSKDIAATQSKVENAGGVIVKAIFSFPGGRRFHFSDPSGNELAVWSDA